MLGENIKSLRKQKGFSQETLAQQLNVTRQTISKWEKGYSVPDAVMLGDLAELFEVPVSTLLGDGLPEEEKAQSSEMAEVAKQLAILNEQLANRTVRRNKTVKRVLLGILIAVVLLIAVWAVCIIAFKAVPAQTQVLTQTDIECTLDGETYGYGFVYDENFRIHEGGGDAFIANHIPIEQYNDVNEALAHIEDYFEDHGGTYKVVNTQRVDTK